MIGARTAVSLLCLARVSACAILWSLFFWPPSADAQVGPANAFGFRWQEAGLRDHPLVGQIWSAGTGGGVDPEALLTRLAAADLVLLGEVHDNSDAHALQGWAIRLLAKHRSGLGVVFEHIRTDQTEALERLDEFDRQARRRATAHDLFRFLDWKSSGWPPEDKMIGLFGAIFDPRLPIYPGSPPRNQVRAVARGDVTALSGEERARLKLDVPLAPSLGDALAAELKASHCGMLPDAAIPGMGTVQRYRDAALADAMLTAAAQHGAAILLAGNGHVRTDRAVPWYLRERAADRRVASVMILEVEDGEIDSSLYIPSDPSGRPTVDFAIFTPRAERPDPCESLRQGPAGKG